MKRILLALFVLAASTALAPSPALALGPVDGEATAYWWHNDFSIEGTGFAEDDAGDLGFRGELWLFERVGFAGAFLRSNLEDVTLDDDTATYAHLDVRFRLFSPSENNFIALGVGWQEAEFQVSPGFGDTSGLRVVAEGRVSAGIVYVYGEVAYMPDLDDVQATPTDLVNIEGLEYEVGIAFKPAPFFQIRLGYHSLELEMERAVTGLDRTLKADGFLLGLGVTF